MRLTIFNANDKDKLKILVLLDYSKSINKINHDLLFLQIIQFCLNRYQRIIVYKLAPSLENVPCGIPHGSILGPLLISVYTSSLPGCFSNLLILTYAKGTQA